VGLVGASSTASARYRRSPEERCPGTRFVNQPETYARAGRSTREMRRLFPRVPVEQHDALVIWGGANNIYQPDQVVEDLEWMVRDARRRNPRIRVYLINLYRWGDYPRWREDFGPKVGRVNTWLRERAPEIGVDGVLDAEAIMQDPDRPTRILPALTADGLHANREGFARLTAALARLLRQRSTTSGITPEDAQEVAAPEVHTPDGTSTGMGILGM